MNLQQFGFSMKFLVMCYVMPLLIAFPLYINALSQYLLNQVYLRPQYKQFKKGLFLAYYFAKLQSHYETYD